MEEDLIVYQKPTCSKCQNLLKTLKDKGVAFDAVNYYEQPFDAHGLKKILAMLKMQPLDLMRKDEQIFKDLNIGDGSRADDELIELMIDNPDLIQRPIVIKGGKAILARPIENINEMIP